MPKTPRDNMMYPSHSPILQPITSSTIASKATCPKHGNPSPLSGYLYGSAQFDSFYHRYMSSLSSNKQDDDTLEGGDTFATLKLAASNSNMSGSRKGSLSFPNAQNSPG